MLATLLQTNTGARCDLLEFAHFVLEPERYPHVTCFTQGESVGIFLTSLPSAISLASIAIVFGLISNNVYQHWRHAPRGSWRLLDGPYDIYLLSLLVFDFMQALSYFLSVNWVISGKTFTGSLCTVQGFLQHASETGGAFVILAMTLHTFFCVFWRKGLNTRRAAFVTTGCIWLVLFLWAAIAPWISGNPAQPYMSPTPYWCRISEYYTSDRHAFELLRGIAVVCCVIAMIPLLLWRQGYISPDEHRWWRFYIHQPSPKIRFFHFERTRALWILRHPLAYTFLSFPAVVVQYINTGLRERDTSVPSLALFTTTAIFALLSFGDAILIIFSRSTVLLFNSTLYAERAAPQTKPLPPVPSPEIEKLPSVKRKPVIRERSRQDRRKHWGVLPVANGSTLSFSSQLDSESALGSVDVDSILSRGSTGWDNISLATSSSGLSTASTTSTSFPGV